MCMHDHIDLQPGGNRVLGAIRAVNHGQFTTIIRAPCTMPGHMLLKGKDAGSGCTSMAVLVRCEVQGSCQNTVGTDQFMEKAWRQS